MRSYRVNAGSDEPTRASCSTIARSSRGALGHADAWLGNFRRADAAAIEVDCTAPVSHPGPQATSPPGLKVVATGMKVSERVRAYLSAALGDDFALVDIRTAPETTDVLLVPPLGAQALGILRGEFPQRH